MIAGCDNEAETGDVFEGCQSYAKIHAKNGLDIIGE